MNEFKGYLEGLSEPARVKLEEVFDWIGKTFPELDRRIAWNQPMFTQKGTFIIGFSASKAHFSVAVEFKTLRLFEEEIKKSDYEV